MRIHALVAVYSLTLPLTACASDENDQDASCHEEVSGYVLTVTGRRDNVTHSLLRFLLQPTVKAAASFAVPRVLGIVPAAEVSYYNEPKLRLTGAVEFTGATMKINLYYVAVDANGSEASVPLSWNGSYSFPLCRN
jgi:hypothetical protein